VKIDNNLLRRAASNPVRHRSIFQHLTLGFNSSILADRAVCLIRRWQKVAGSMCKSLHMLSLHCLGGHDILLLSGTCSTYECPNSREGNMSVEALRRGGPVSEGAGEECQ
jgi:hypothetical protein